MGATAVGEWDVTGFLLEEPVEECFVEAPGCFFEEPEEDEELLLAEPFGELFLELFFLEDEDLAEEEAGLP